MQLHFSHFWCAQYVAGDSLGEVLSLASMLPYFIILHTASRSYCRRDLVDLMTLIGLVANEVLARGLKHILKQPRPTDRCMDLDTCESYGSPSSHTMCVFFALALHVALPLLGSTGRGRERGVSGAAGKESIARGGARGRKGPTGGFETLIWATELVGLALAAAAVAFSRVYLTYHSVDQVALGAVIGLAFGGVWTCLIAALAPLYAAVSGSSVGGALSLRDSWGQHDAPAVERAALRAWRDGEDKRQE